MPTVRKKNSGIRRMPNTWDGEQADDSKQQWWCLTKGGEMVNTSADLTPIADGDRYELTLKEGY